MDLSPKAVSQILENYLKKNPEEKEKFKKKGRVLVSDMRDMFIHKKMIIP